MIGASCFNQKGYHLFSAVSESISVCGQELLLLSRHQTSVDGCTSTDGNTSLNFFLRFGTAMTARWLIRGGELGVCLMSSMW